MHSFIISLLLIQRPLRSNARTNHSNNLLCVMKLFCIIVLIAIFHSVTLYLNWYACILNS